MEVIEHEKNKCRPKLSPVWNLEKNWLIRIQNTTLVSRPVSSRLFQNVYVTQRHTADLKQKAKADRKKGWSP
jgi:hypothetical protein